MRIENASLATMKIIKSIGKLAFWIFCTTFAFSLVAATVELIKNNTYIY